jgi:hypothetical protein
MLVQSRRVTIAALGRMTAPDSVTGDAGAVRHKPIRVGHDMDKRNDSREGQLHPRPAIDNPADGRSKL